MYIMKYEIILIGFVFACFSMFNGGHCLVNRNMDLYLLGAGNDLLKTRLDKISMQEGDVIDCGSHFLLATGPDKVIHLKVGRQNKGYLVEEYASSLSSDIYNCTNLGPGPKSRSESVDIARQFKIFIDSLGKDLFYDPISCEPDHFVNFWTARSMQSSSIKTTSSVQSICSEELISGFYYTVGLKQA